MLEQPEQGRARGHEAAARLVLGQVVEAPAERRPVLVDELEQLLAGRRGEGDLALEGVRVHPSTVAPAQPSA
ncbi:hypothetical protein VN1338_45200 [Helicobacter pylori]